MGTVEGIPEACSPLHKLVILLAASNGGEPIRGRARLQKMALMLTDRKGWEGGPCGYDAGVYGPHSDIVDEEAGCLEEAGSCALAAAAAAAAASPPLGWAGRPPAGSRPARTAAHSPGSACTRTCSTA